MEEINSIFKRELSINFFHKTDVMSEPNVEFEKKQFKERIFEILFAGEDEYIPGFVIDNIPSLLRDCCGVFNERREKDVFLTGALVALGGSFHNLYAYNEVDRKNVSPNLVAFIVAPPASGKRALEYSKKLIYGIRDTFQSVKKRKLIIPANNSAAGLLQLMYENEGAGVIIESEIDTLLNAQKQEWGKNSDIIRNSFDNENYSMYRKLDKEYIEIEKPKLSIALSGTENQFKELMVSVENGLFSRGCYYFFEDNQPTLKSFGRLNTELNIDDQFARFAKIANDYYEQLCSYEKVQVRFTELQLRQIQATLQEYYDYVYEENKELEANVKRAFTIALKISTILEALSRVETGTMKEDNECMDNSLKVGMLLTATYLSHSLLALEAVGGQKKLSAHSDNFTRLYQSLPKEFLKTEVIEKAISMRMSQRTAYNAIKFFRDKNWIELNIEGKFKKIK